MASVGLLYVGAVLWALFFVVLGLKRQEYTRYTGAVCLTQGIVTGAIPAFLLLTDSWAGQEGLLAVVLAVFAVVASGAFYPRFGPAAPTAPTALPTEPTRPAGDVPVDR